MAVRYAFVVGIRNFKTFVLKRLSLGKMLILGFSLFHSTMTEEKKVYFKELSLTIVPSIVRPD